MHKAIEKALLMQELDLFRFASADHLMQLAEICHEEMLEAGDILFRQGEPAGRLFLLVLGRTALEGSEKQFLPKAALNLWSCLTESAHLATCRCLEDCTVLTIATADLLDLLVSESELCLALLRYSAWNRLAVPN